MLIGLSGKMGSGKTTLVNFMQQYYTDVVPLKFATPLYELQDYIYNKLGYTLEGEKDRELLIKLGEWAKSKDPAIFAKLGLQQLPKQEDLLSPIYVFDDVRFPDEANLIKENGGILIRLEGEQRGSNVNKEYFNSPSETSLDNYNFDYYINNSGSFLKTIEQLKSIIKDCT